MCSLDYCSMFYNRSILHFAVLYPSWQIDRLFNLETNTVVESCDVTFDKTTPCPRDVFECAGDKEMEESIFVDDRL
jgi:hypothetical protein